MIGRKGLTGGGAQRPADIDAWSILRGLGGSYSTETRLTLSWSVLQSSGQ